jgi:hypothetical protein
MERITMSKKQIVIILSFVFVLVAESLSVCGQGKGNELKDKKVTIQMANKPLYTVFGRLIYKYDIAIGFEESTLDKDHDHYHFETNVPTDEWKPDYLADKEVISGSPKFDKHLITVNYKDGRLEDVINAIVKQMQNYDWEINNDVVNIFPIRGRDPRFEKLLKLRIREFVVRSDAEVGIIQPLIVLGLPEFRSFLADNNLYAESDRTAPAFIERPLPAGMKFSDLTFRELLNEITKSKRGGWILKTNKLKKPENKDKEFIDILI